MNALSLFGLISLVSIAVLIATGTLYDWTPNLIIRKGEIRDLIKAALILFGAIPLVNVLAGVVIYHFAGALAVIWVTVPMYVSYRTITYCRSLYKNDMYAYLKIRWNYIFKEREAA